MRVCLIAEKNSLALNVLPTIREMHPNLDMGGFACAFVNPFIHLNSRFRYPRGLSMRDYPFTGEAVYEPFEFGEIIAGRKAGFLPRFAFALRDPEPAPAVGSAWVHDAAWLAPDTQPTSPHREATLRIRDADLVYAAIDPSPSSLLALERCIAELGLRRDRISIPYLWDLSRARIRGAFQAPGKPDDAAYEARVAGARARRRFDYAYQVNALALHGRAMRLSGAHATAMAPSKYGLQLLYAMREAGPLGEGHWVERMHGWKGTGRYAAPGRSPGDIRGMGGCASRHVILQALQDSGLAGPMSDRLVGVSELGLRFLDRLHPDSEDKDLPLRLQAWIEDPDGEARVDRYIRTFFGRQIRFQSRSSATATAEDLA